MRGVRIRYRWFDPFWIVAVAIFASEVLWAWLLFGGA